MTEWMEKNIWQYGCCMTAGEMIRKLTGHGLDAGPFLRYLEQKYLEQKYQADCSESLVMLYSSFSV